MPRDLSIQQGQFVEAVIAGISPCDAARLAGYSAPSQDAYRLMRSSSVLNAITERQKAWFYGVGMPLAKDRLEKLLRDDTCPKGIALNAAKFVFEYIATLENANTIKDLIKKPVSDMTPDELEIFIKEGRMILRQNRLPEPSGDKDQAQKLGIIDV